MKLHIGCGPVYLTDGWTNCDVSAKGHYLASERPDLVDINSTTMDNYYKKNIGRNEIEKRKFNKELVVADVFCNARRLPFPNNSIDEIYSNQLFEHFTFKQGKLLLKHWHKKLINRGVLRIDTPDLEGTIKGLHDATTEEDKAWYTRLLFGSQKNTWGLHKSMYSKESIIRLLHSCGFIDIEFGENIHFYPAFEVRAVKYE